MATHLLELEYDEEIEVIGIATYLPDYRLCWELNRAFGFKLQRWEDVLMSKRAMTGGLFSAEEKEVGFANYGYNSGDRIESIRLLANKKAGMKLIPGCSKFDFLLGVISSELAIESVEDTLRSKPHMQIVESISPERYEDFIDVFCIDD